MGSDSTLCRKRMRKMMAALIALTMASVGSMGCLNGVTNVLPEEVILTSDRIPKEWTVVSQE